MKRCGWILAVAVIALTMLALEANASAQWVTRQIGWSGPGAAGAVKGGGGGSDTLYITDEADTNLTTGIVTSDWDWQTLAMAKGSDAAAFRGVTLTLVADLNNGAADTCYALIGPGYGGAYGRPGGIGLYSTTTTAANLIAGNSASSNVTWGAGKIVFQGQLNLDSDTRGAGNAWLLPEFQLVIVGDVGGTTPKLSGCRLYLTYPKRMQP